MARLLVLLLLLAGTAGATDPDQRADQLEVLLPPPARRGVEPPSIRSVGLLVDGRTRDLLHHGFPARMHYKVELWSTAGWFDKMLQRREWDVIVRYVPLDRRYVVTRLEGETITTLGTFEELAKVQALLDAPYQPPLRAAPPGDRVYYNAELEVEMMSVNDLDELERWLRGELRPAARGERNPGTAVTRGVRSLVIRLLGSENRRYQARSRTFRAAG
ncbi:MAG TPA: DUF4390 domain-containing protein [Gemmatimonadaceae bacterium]|nr:DUF4390 domain-containing protein [Gemmatimonadaceae bacterium]